MENKASKTKASVSVPVVSGGNKIVEKKLNNQVVELVSTTPTLTLTKKGGAKKTEVVKVVAETNKSDAKKTDVVETKKGGAKKTDVAETKKGGAKKTDVVEVVAETKKGGAKKTDVVEVVAETKKGGAKKTDVVVAETKKGGAKKTETVAAETKSVVTTELEAEPEAQSKLRYFKLFYNNEICGRYCGKKPKQAANKAFSSIIKDMKKDGVVVTGESQLEVPFTIKECTRNSKHKEYKYIGKRHLLKEPVKVSIENSDGSVKEIVYKFHNQLQKAPKV